MMNPNPYFMSGNWLFAGGWFYKDRTGRVIGPFSSEQDALMELLQHCKELEESPEWWEHTTRWSRFKKAMKELWHDTTRGQS